MSPRRHKLRESAVAKGICLAPEASPWLPQASMGLVYGDAMPVRLGLGQNIKRLRPELFRKSDLTYGGGGGAQGSRWLRQTAAEQWLCYSLFQADGYDPMTDPRRKAKSNDPGWRYRYLTYIRNQDKVSCILCKRVTMGGIKILKEHLAGGYAGISMCAETTIKLRKEMREYMEKNKRNRPILLDDARQQLGRSTSIVQPSSGTAAKRRRAAFQFRIAAAAITASSGDVAEEGGAIASMLQRTPDQQIMDEERCNSSESYYQCTMEASIEPRPDKDYINQNYINQQWAMWFYKCGIMFNTIISRQFQIACEATVQYGSGYMPPSSHDLREPLLDVCVKETSNMRAEHEIVWKKYGCTLAVDGWTDGRRHHLINFLLNSLEGTYFLESVDASSEKHDANLLADLLEKKN